MPHSDAGLDYRFCSSKLIRRDATERIRGETPGTNKRFPQRVFRFRLNDVSEPRRVEGPGTPGKGSHRRNKAGGDPNAALLSGIEKESQSGSPAFPDPVVAV